MWNDAQKIGAYLNSEAGRTKRVQAPFSPLSFPAQGKRYSRRRRVRNDHDGTNPCRQGFLSSVLVFSFPNRKLNLRFGFFYANLRQPLSLGCAEPAPLEGEPRVPHRRKYSELGGNLSVSLRLTAPLKGEPFGVLDSLVILKSGTNHRRYVL